MNNETDPDRVPAYACNIVGQIDGAFTHVPEVIQQMRQESCQTCGYPHHDAGPLCPRCEQVLQMKCRAMGEALADHLHSRWVHIYGIGRVDPWSREGRDLIGDG